ncbi:MAG: hypothetical protein Q9200_004238 [Gallowayella weberi]
MIVHTTASTPGRVPSPSSSVLSWLKEQWAASQERTPYPLSSSPNPLKRKRSSSGRLKQDHLPQSTEALGQSERTHPAAANLPDSPPQPGTPSISPSILPLTQDNLRKLHQTNGDMLGFKTPQKSDVSKTTSQLSKHTGRVREILELKGLSIDNQDAREAFKKELDQLEDFLKKPRHSNPSPTLLQEINKRRLDYGDRNEATFTNRFFGVFQCKSRDVQRPEMDDDDESTFHVPAIWGARDWEDDGLDENHNRVFQAGSVPKIFPLDDDQKAILEDLPKISNPQPDIIFGTSIKANYTKEERAVISTYTTVAQISLGLAFPFFSVEAKTSGNFEDGVNQACVTGAAMVEALRKLKVLADPPKPKAKGTKDKTKLPKDGAIFDTGSIAFSMVLMPKFAEINVHWVEISKQGEKVTYHMTSIGSYALKYPESLKACRAAANNILDWGLGERNRDIKGLLKKILDREAKMAAKGKGKGKNKNKSVVEVDTESDSDDANGRGEKRARGD